MELVLKKGPRDLESRVLDQGLCCSCGACMSLCPYLIGIQEQVVLFEDCGLKEGRCYDICPRTVVDMDDLNKQVFDKERDDYLLGSHKQILMAQSLSQATRESGQYGGMATELLCYALEKGIIDGTIVAGWSSRYDFMPEPVLARTPEQVRAAAGSKYTACPSLSILDKSLSECEKLAIVGRPCQITALRKRERVEPEIKDKIALTIGLFCMWALNYRELCEYLRPQIDLGCATGVDIPFNRFVIKTEQGPKEMEFEPIRGLRRETCDLCYDFTSEFADLSVGSTEWKEDWNTLITRTESGAALIDKAVKDARVITEVLPVDRVELLRGAALGKKKRVIEALAEKDCLIPDYLVLSDKEKESIKKG